MAAARFLHISFNFEGKPPQDKKLEEIFNKALDWIRYAPNCWILYTTTDMQEWAKRLRDALPHNYSIFVVEVDMSKKTGFMHKSVWDWIERDRTKKS